MRIVATLAALFATAVVAGGAHAQSTTWSQVNPTWSQVNRFDRPVLTLPLSGNTTLIFQPPEQRPWGDFPGTRPDAPEKAFGLEFKAGRDTGGLPKHVLRVQLSSKESLQFRPRGGGLAIAYRAQF